MTGRRTERARELRRDATLAERILWSMVRNRNLEGYKFRRQVPIDRYTVDFVCFDARLVIELDGSQHADREAQDQVRTKVLERCGFQVIRFWNGAVLRSKTGVALTILDALKRPLPEGEGGARSA